MFGGLSNTLAPAAAVRAQDPNKGARRLKTVFLYTGAPLLVILYAAANNWKLLEDAGVWVTLGYYTAHAVATWPVTALMTWLVWRGLAPLRPGLVVITVAGSVLGCLATAPYMDLIVNALPSAGGTTDTVDWSRMVNSALRATAVWVGINWIFDRYLDLPRYRYGAAGPTTAEDPAAQAPPSPGSPAPGPALLAPAHRPGADVTAESPDNLPIPAFLQRVTKPVTLESLLAIRAEQHYIMVISDAGQELVLYRFSDAVRELAPGRGVQVHRSWWVNGSAVGSVAQGYRKMGLTLRNGLEVPVSAPYQALARTLLARYGLIR